MINDHDTRILSPVTFQDRVYPWMLTCFGFEITFDRIERNQRFLEESLETVQANGCTRDEAHQLVDYVFDRPVGELTQEVGGVMVTLAALCVAAKLDMHEAGERELARIWTLVESIRTKQAAKTRYTTLSKPIVTASTEPQQTMLTETWYITLKWLAMLLGVGGSIAAATVRDHVMTGFVLFLLSSLIWVGVAWRQREYSLLVLQTCFVIIDSLGIMTWMQP